MNFDEYQKAAVSTAIYPKAQAVVYPILGLTNESGEVAGKLKKIFRDGNGEFTQEARQNLADELGDVLWYIAATARDLEITMNEIAERNIAKLQDRKVRGVIGGSGDNR